MFLLQKQEENVLNKINGKKGIVTPITVFFLGLTFVITYIFFTGDFLTLASQMALAQDIPGYEKFFYANLHLIVWIAFIIAMIAFATFAGGSDR